MRIEPQPFWRNERVELFLLECSNVGEAYVEWLNDADVNRFLESRFTTHDIATTRRFVEDALADPASLLLGIHDPRSGRHIGNIKLGPINRHHGVGEIGLMIGDRDAWGHGFASSAIAVISSIAFEQLGLRKVTAGCYGQNVGSRRAFEKAGYLVEGVRERHFLIEGVPEDLVLLARFA